MKKINRAVLRGRPLDKDCYIARTCLHQYGFNDNRCYCLGLINKRNDEFLEKCLECKAFVNNATPLEVENG